MYIDNSTICAISTPSGVGGVALIRVSGPHAVAICNKRFSPRKQGDELIERPARSLTYGVWNDPSDRPLDDVVAGLFLAPHSFTGEDTVEITCHGSIYIQQQILQTLLASGCRMASAGEFTQRAFLNGKMDLSQAEGVADLIAASSASAHKLALNQMRGGFSSELNRLREKLLDIVSLIELELDFGEEDVEFADRAQLQQLTVEIIHTLQKLTRSFAVGNAIKNGIPVAIVGETNVGKSTLLNRLLNEERAIVSHIHGTTRDVIEDTVTIGGYSFRFIDTAGIRQTSDAIETMGIERTFERMNKATIILWVLDGRQTPDELRLIRQQIEPGLHDRRVIVVVNKADLIDAAHRPQLETYLDGYEIVFLSARNDPGMEELEHRLLHALHLSTSTENDVVVTNLRHFEALTHALTALERVNDGLTTTLSGDFISQDLRECFHHLGLITGQISTDDVLGNIFSKFCIGK